MFKLSKFKICIIGMITGITLIEAYHLWDLYVVIVRRIDKQNLRSLIQTGFQKQKFRNSL